MQGRLSLDNGDTFRELAELIVEKQRRSCVVPAKSGYE